VVRPAPGLAWQTIDGEGVVLDLVRGRSLGLNATAALVFSLLETQDEDAIADELVRRYPVGAEEARDDVRRFVTLLRERGLVVDA